MTNHDHFRTAAQMLASKGRGGDSMLVHMAPQEVAGLASLGRLTKNPKTGLPEAFSLMDIIPAIAAIGGTVLSGGNPLVGAAAAGGTKTLMGVSQGEPFMNALEHGLMTGALSYGLGSLGGSLVGAGAAGAAAGEGAGMAATEPAAEAATTAATEPLAEAAPAAAGASSGQGLDAMSSAYGMGPDAVPAATGASYGQAGAASAGQAFGPNIPPTDPTSGAYWSDMWKGVNAPGALKNALTDKSTMLPLAIGGYGTLTGVGDVQTVPTIPSEPAPTGLKKVQALGQYQAPPSGYRPGIDPEWNYFGTPGMAAGGLVGLASGGLASMGGENHADINLIMEAKAALSGQHPNGSSIIERFTKRFGPEAIKALRASAGLSPAGYAGMVKGPGGGLDDLVPASLNGKQPIDLADGEHVVPADVVSMMGDGSSDAGSRKLTEMEQRVRMQKTGTTKQAGHIRVGMPA